MHTNRFYRTCEKRVIGTKYFGPTIDITDPCYNKDVWCRMNGVEVTAGTYTCVAWFDPIDEEVAVAGIYLDGQIRNDKTFRENGFISVDAGLAGFFNNKPDYNDDEWENFCDILNEPDENGVLKDAWITEDGFFTSSGDGDGRYPVYLRSNDKGQVTAVEICFY